MRVHREVRSHPDAWSALKARADAALRYARKVWAIVAKDIAAELRTWELVSAMLVYCVLALLIYSLALELQGELARLAAPGVLWATVILAGTLGLSRSLVREQQARSLDALLLAPMDRTAIYFGKALGILLFMGVVEAALLPLLLVLYDVSLLRAPILLVMALGTAGYAAAGTLLTSIAVNTRAREVMAPVLLLPLTVPIVIAAVQATAGLLEGLTLGQVGGWVRLLVAYDLVIVAVALLTYPYVVEE